MRTTEFDKHRIITILMPTVTNFISRQKPDKIISPPSKEESKVIDIFLGVNKITECLDQINFSIEMLSGYRKKENNKMNRHDYIVFMIENFYLRITSIFDRVMRFSNLVFEIGLPERECRESTIIKNNKIRGTDVEVALKEINKFVSNFRPIRNEVAHADTFQDNELSPIRDFYFLIEQDDSDNLEKYKNIYKVRADKYIIDKKKELTESAEQIKKLTSNFFDSIAPFVELNMNRTE